MTPSTTIATGNIATNTTFTAGVYDVAGLLTTTAGITITLDAQGTGDDFIFNIDSYLTFGADTQVVVVNGDGTNGVVWNSTGSYVTSGAGADIIGTILAHTYVSTGANSTLRGTGTSCGGAYSATGAVTVGAGSVTGGVGCSGSTPPPAVPLPAAAWLFGSALLGLVGVARRKKAGITVKA
jgi:hypothetical protein